MGGRAGVAVVFKSVQIAATGLFNQHRESIGMSDTFERVKALLIKEFGLEPAGITPSTQLTDLGVDSLAALEFVFDLEDCFQITLDSETDLRGGAVQDVVNAVDFVLSRQSARMVVA